MRKLIGFQMAVLAMALGCGGGSTGPGAGGNGGGGGGGGGGGATCPAGSVCMLSSAFNPTSITIARNGSVNFVNESGVQHNVIFEAGNPQGGDIPLHTSGTNARTFATAGTFGFHCSVHGDTQSGMRGSVIVQ